MTRKMLFGAFVNLQKAIFADLITPFPFNPPSDLKRFSSQTENTYLHKIWQKL